MDGEGTFLLMSAARAERAITRIARQIIEGTKGQANIIIFGIDERGGKLSHILADRLTGILDTPIPNYKIAVKTGGPEDVAGLGVDITGKYVIIIDDVIFSGKTMYQAFERVMELGQPERVRLAALVDRGHRVYPIEAEYVGLVSPTKLDEHVSCMFAGGKPDGVKLEVS